MERHVDGVMRREVSQRDNEVSESLLVLPLHGIAGMSEYGWRARWQVTLYSQCRGLVTRHFTGRQVYSEIS